MRSLKVSSKLTKNNTPIGIMILTRASDGKDLVGEKKGGIYSFTKPNVPILTEMKQIGETGRRFSQRIIDHSGHDDRL